MNIILSSDSYKYSQWPQYPNGTEAVFSYGEARGGKYAQAVWFGMQAFTREYLVPRITMADIDEAEEIITAHGMPFNRRGWEYILNVYDGKLPVIIKSLPEGTIAPISCALFTIENTGGPETAFLTSFLETPLLRAAWYGTTVATNSFESKKLIMQYLEKSGDPETIDFKLHDFGSRGVSSEESSAIGGTAHLVNFQGTDNVSALVHARKYYDEPMAGFSIPAMEHSTVTSWGREGEFDSYDNMIDTYGKPGAMFAMVLDSYNMDEAVKGIGRGKLKQKIIESGATVVIRPDSGDPATVVTQTLKQLERDYGSVKNEKGYRVLNNVRVIQGDGIDIDSIRHILFCAVDMAGFSADNIAFGQGGALLQQVNRDTMAFAMKCSAIKIRGEWRDVYKDPITDSGKKSKRGRLAVHEYREGLVTGREDWMPNKLVTIFENGELFNQSTLAEIRARANKPFEKIA